MLSFKQYLEEKRLRYKRPSVNTILGITSLKKKVRKVTGINAIARWKPSRVRARVMKKVGLYGNPVTTTIRQLSKGHAPSLYKFIPKGWDI